MIASSRSAKRTSVRLTLISVAPTSTGSDGAAAAIGKPVVGSTAPAVGAAAASTLGLMMKLMPRLSGSRFLASSFRSLMTSLSGRPSQPLSSRMRLSLSTMSCRPLLV